MKLKLCLAMAFFSLIFVSKQAIPQSDPVMDTLVKAAKLALHYEGRSICAKDAKVNDLANAIDDYALTHRIEFNKLSNEDIYLSLIGYFPCPFNPKKTPVRHAVAADLIGYWEIVPASFKLKTNNFENEIFPSNCQYFSYSEDGKRSSIDIMTKGICPTVTVANLQMLKTVPKTIGWILEPGGMLKITSINIPAYIESWETFVVNSTFSHDDVVFEEGDMLMFMRQYNQTNGAEIGTLYFRQIRRMAGPKKLP